MSTRNLDRICEALELAAILAVVLSPFVMWLR
jgi:hypothetical protein